MSDVDPSLGEEIFDVPQAQREAKIELDAEPDHAWREPVAPERNGFHACLAKWRNAASGDKLSLG
ncbi:hypothetical protein MB02_11555 [Croceicoccus estronivorus]|nr:hypothetical protein MB02_11555 [Croceicoccus estronivorus]